MKNSPTTPIPDNVGIMAMHVSGLGGGSRTEEGEGTALALREYSPFHEYIVEHDIPRARPRLNWPE